MSSGKVLVGVDGSEGSRRALRWAVEEAVVRGAVLEAVTVWQSPYEVVDLQNIQAVEEELAESARKELSEAVAEVVDAQPKVSLVPVVVEGDPAQVLCQRAAGAELLVVGSRGHGTLTGVALGSVSTKCAHHSPGPLAIIPPPRRGDRRQPEVVHSRILVGIDGSPGSRQALEWAVAEAGRRGSSVDALSVWRGAEADDEMTMEFRSFPLLRRADQVGEASAEDRLAEAVAALGVTADAVEINQRVLEGDPAQILCQKAEEADLLVVGSRGHGTLKGLLLGSVSTQCAHHSPRPVVIVPTARDAAASSPPGGA